MSFFKIFEMKKYSFITLLVLINLSGYNQNFGIWNMRNNDSSNHYVGLGFSYQSTINMGLGYAHVFKLGKETARKIALEIEIASPLLLIATSNKDLYLSGSSFLFNKPFDVKTTLGFQAKSFDDVMASGSASYFNLHLQPGYFQSKYFVAAELAYNYNIATTFHFNSDYYPNREDLTFYHVHQHLDFGINAGVLLKQKFELILKGIYQISTSFRNYAPYTRNYGVTFGINYSI